MQEDTRFLLRRMDTLEQRVMDRIDRLEAFKNRLLGMAFLGGGVAGLIIDLIAKHIS